MGKILKFFSDYIIIRPKLASIHLLIILICMLTIFKVIPANENGDIAAKIFVSFSAGGLFYAGITPTPNDARLPNDVVIDERI